MERIAEVQLCCWLCVMWEGMGGWWWYVCWGGGVRWVRQEGTSGDRQIHPAPQLAYVWLGPRRSHTEENKCTARGTQGWGGEGRGQKLRREATSSDRRVDLAPQLADVGLGPGAQPHHEVLVLVEDRGGGVAPPLVGVDVVVHWGDGAVQVVPVERPGQVGLLHWTIGSQNRRRFGSGEEVVLGLEVYRNVSHRPQT